EYQVLAFQVRNVANRTDVDQRARQERTDRADIDGETALDLATDNPLDDLFLGVGLFQLDPHFGALGFFTREAGEAEAVVDSINCYFNVVAYCDFQLPSFVEEFFAGDNAL